MVDSTYIFVHEEQILFVSAYKVTRINQGTLILTTQTEKPLTISTQLDSSAANLIHWDAVITKDSGFVK